MHLKHIVTQDKNSLLKTVFIAQLKSPSKGAWTSEVTQIFEELNIQKNFDEIKDLSKNQLTKIVKLAIEKNAFNYLISIQKQKQKGKEIIYKNLSLQPYLRPRENFNLKAQRQIFALRTKMSHVKTNFCSSKYIDKCDKCNFEMDNIHLFKCTR